MLFSFYLFTKKLHVSWKCISGKMQLRSGIRYGYVKLQIKLQHKVGGLQSTTIYNAIYKDIFKHMTLVSLFNKTYCSFQLYFRQLVFLFYITSSLLKGAPSCDTLSFLWIAICYTAICFCRKSLRVNVF